MIKKQYPKGALVFEEGDARKDIYILVGGGVEILKGGKRIALIVEEGAFIGEMSYLLGEARTASCLTVTQTELLIIPADKFEESVQKSPSLAVKLARALAARLYLTTKELSLLKNKHQVKEETGGLDEFLAKMDWMKKMDIAKSAGKEYFFSNSQYSFEQASKLYNRYLRDLMDVEADREFVKNPVERVVREHGVMNIFRQYVEREYNLLF